MHTLGWQRTGGRARRRLAALVAVALGGGLLGGAAGPGVAGAQDAPLPETITINGRGWGHGRGLGQWGAFGYATGRSGGPWGYRTILDHFYGDTQVGGIANPLAAVTLLGQRGLPLSVERAAGVAVLGQADTAGAFRATLRPDGRFDLQSAGSCAEGWSEPVVVDGPVRIQAPAATGEADDGLRLCHPEGGTTGYRGELVAMGRSFDGGEVGLAQAVNLVRLDDLLRSVVPRQVPPVWVDADDGRGRNAVLAQVVAARGFVAAGDGRWRDLHSGLGAAFSTCDSLACQLYEGVGAEDPRTDEAVRDTSGEVRVRGSVLIRTEFTASSGGWTAGGSFPAVFDQGDAVTANPNRQWSTLIDRSTIEARYGLGRLQAISVLERNGLGPDGGRVLRLALVGTATTVELTGQQFRAAFGLRSDWFTVSGTPPRPPVTPRSIDAACPPGQVRPAGFTDVPATNVHLRAIDCVRWWEITTGTGFARFGPAGLVTRGQMASFIARTIVAAGGVLPEDPPDAFVDDAGSVHEPAINALTVLGVVRGVGASRYDPRSPVERAQTAALVARTLEHLTVGLAPDPSDAFADDTGSVHEPAINALAADGILAGTSAGRLDPRSPTRRDQMASLLARALALVVVQHDIPTP